MLLELRPWLCNRLLFWRDSLLLFPSMLASMLISVSGSHEICGDLLWRLGSLLEVLVNHVADNYNAEADISSNMHIRLVIHERIHRLHHISTEELQSPHYAVETVSIDVAELRSVITVQ